jgi:hypothetical protein
VGWSTFNNALVGGEGTGLFGRLTRERSEVVGALLIFPGKLLAHNFSQNQ